LFGTFFKLFCQLRSFELELYLRQGFKLPYFFKIANLKLKISAILSLFDAFSAVLRTLEHEIRLEVLCWNGH
jgi:hypothetical protein